METEYNNKIQLIFQEHHVKKPKSVKDTKARKVKKAKKAGKARGGESKFPFTKKFHQTFLSP